jgi:hypothetical protein
MTDCLLSATEMNELQNHDDFKVIWFGSDNYVSNELNNFTDYLEKYYSFEDCYNHIRKIRSELKILLVLTDFYQNLSDFHALPQVQCSRCGGGWGVLAPPLFGCVCENFQCVWEIFACVSAKIQFTPEGEYRRSLQSYPPPWPSLLKNQPKLFFSVL